MGNCSSTNATNPKANRGPKKFVRPRTDDDDKTEVDFDRLREEQRQRLAQEEEMNRLIYAEKAALKEITSRLIEKRASCESLMDLLEPSELVDISLDDSSFRAQKRVRRKLMKKNQVNETHEWMLYNNVDGIAEPHMVHLALFMQKVMTTLSRIEAIKSNQSQRHAKSEAQLTKLQLSPKGNMIIAPVTPPSSPITSSRTHKGGRKTLQRHEDDSPPRESESESRNPFRTVSCDSSEIPNDAATMAIIEQQRLLEEEYLRTKHEHKHKHHSGDEHDTHGHGTGSHSSDHADGLPAGPDHSLAVGAPESLASGSQDKFSPPSPPPSPNGSPRSPSSAPYTPTGSPRIGDTHTDTTTTDTGALLTSASLCLRLGELLSPEDAQLLSGVQGGTSDLLENVRSSKSHAVNHQTLFANVSPEMQAQYRQELLSLQVCIIAPQTSYEITQANLYDYDLPPGLVTLRVAHTVMQLYRRGGRLTPKSVHKLLRLGYRSLHKKANTTQVAVLPGDTLTIVGDLHGQLPDLLHILQTSGLPSRTNKYIFNGDFVDRGAYGVEVMCTLLALHIAMPDHVILNRGNHEDFAICTAYGFQMECCEKYGDVIFGMFVEIFQQLPLFAIVNKSMLVLHGGLFHTTDTSLAELEAIDRAAFSLQDIPEGGDGITAISRSDRDQYLKQLVRDALWSDPADHDGLQASVRGAGVSFGADVTRAFLKANDLQFVVRSHECVRSGYNEPYSGPDKHLLCTIFSASDYGGSGNSAAILQFHIPTEEETATHAPKDAGNTQENGVPTLEQAVLQMESQEEDCPEFSELKFVQGTDLCYRVHHYFVAPNFFDQDTTALVDAHQSTTDLTVLHNTMQNSSPSAVSANAAADAASDSPPPEGRTPTPAADKDLPPKMTAAGRSVSLQAPRKQSLDGKSMIVASSGASIAAANAADAAVTGSEASRHGRSKSMTAYTGNLSFQHMGLEDDGDGNDGLVVSDRDCVLIGSKMSLFEFIVSRLDELRKEFESVDKRSSGVVTKYQWVNVMREVMSLHIRWISLMQVLVLESHFRIYHGKKMVDYSAFLGSFNPEEENEEFGELVTDEYTAALNANHSGSTKNNTTLNAGTAIVNEVTESKFEEEAEESASVGAGGVQNKAPFSDLITSPVSTDAGSGSSSEEAQTDRETPSVDTSVGSPRDDDCLSAIAAASTSAAAAAAAADASLECESAKVHTVETAEGGTKNSPLGSARKKVTFVGTDDADLASSTAITSNTSPLAAGGNGDGAVAFSPDTTCSTSVDGVSTTALSPPVNSAHASQVQVPSRTRRTSSAAKLGRRNSESLIRSVDVSPPVLLPAQMYCAHRISRELMEVLYIDYKEVESAFRYFDRDSDGFIKSAEFRSACKELNKYLPRGQKIRDIDSLLMLMDIEETGEIAFNNFFELFRLSEMKLNVGIDDEDSLLSSLHHSDMKDVVMRQHSVSGYGSFSVTSPSKLAIHGVQINVDSEFPQPPQSPHASKLTRGDSPLGLNIDA